MTRRWRSVAAIGLPASLALAAALTLSAGCGRNDPLQVGDANRASEPKIAPPVDRLAPGELEPGDEIAFGLPIPKGMRVVRRFDDSTHAKGRVDHDELVAYLKRRLATSHLTYEPDKVVFPEVRIRNDAAKGTGNAAQDTTLRVEVWADREMTWLRVTDTTVPPAVEGLTEAERWRRAGMHPDGSPLDPNSLR